MTGDRGDGVPGALPDRLATLFAAERSAPLVDASAASVVRAKLTSTVGERHRSAMRPQAARSRPPARCSRSSRSSPRRRGRSRRASTASASPGGWARSSRRHRRPSPCSRCPRWWPYQRSRSRRPPGRPAPPERRAPAPHARARPPAADPTPETAILREAWTAMSAGDAARALALADDDARAHPDGAFVEEARRRADRRARGARSRRRGERGRYPISHPYPHSVHRALVERALHREVSP